MPNVQMESSLVVWLRLSLCFAVSTKVYHHRAESKRVYLVVASPHLPIRNTPLHPHSQAQPSCAIILTKVREVALRETPLLVVVRYLKG